MSSSSDGRDLVETIRNAIIGNDCELDGPFGPRLVTYADYTASGRCLTFIEDFLRDNVMPTYANTHTESSGTGRQTSRFREDARHIIARALGCTDEDVVLFCGSGATGAVNKLIDILNLRLPADLNERYELESRIPASERPVVFIGPYEHHSNELPWRESIADVVVIDEDENGKPDPDLLIAALEKFASRPLRIGSFSAASNVTGIGSRTQEISAILHRHGALAFWDFAAAGPYVQIDMNLTRENCNDYKDAIFLSPHKFIGGPGTPGVLVVKRALLQNSVPSVVGGGTVAYVSASEHRYLEDPTLREEGGTPSIIGAIRAGLVFQLKEAVGTERIRELEDSFIRRAIERWSKHDNIQILGNPESWRLSIVSFVLRHGDRYLHHNFVVSLLNDLFGLQARGGCSCAGPYGHRLLDIDVVQSEAYRREIMRGCEGIKPGWTRINFNYFIAEDVFDFILDAVDWVATHGWKLLPLYEFSADSGLWSRPGWEATETMRLDDVCYDDGALEFPHRLARREMAGAYASYLARADELIGTALAAARTASSCPLRVTGDFERLRWFPLPDEIATALAAGGSSP